MLWSARGREARLHDVFPLPSCRACARPVAKTVRRSRSKFQFSQFDGRPAVTGELHGSAVLTCQRCMRPVSVDVDDTFQVLIVDAERSDEPGGYEPVVAHPARLDLAWLAEEQVLLALPLVPMHESEDCGAGVLDEVVSSEALEDDVEDADDAESGAGTTQQPFRNLRDLLRKQ